MMPLYNPSKSPVGAHVHKTTYEPLINTPLYVMLLMQANPGEGWALKISTFLGPKRNHQTARCHFTGPKKI